MTQYLFEDLKDLFLSRAENINLDNAEGEIPVLIKFLELMEEVAKLGQEEEDMDLLLEDQENFDFQEDAPYFPEEPEEEEKTSQGVLLRQLKGGILEGDGIYVPERSIREFGFEDGDLIQAKSQGMKHMGNKFREFYYFDCIQKGQKVDSKRKEISFARVLRDEGFGQYYILKPGEDREIRIPLNQEDVESLNIEEDDRVEYAYWQGEIDQGRVAWKYTLNGPVVEKPEEASWGPEDSLQGLDLVLALDQNQEESYREELNRLGVNYVSLEEINQAYRENRTILADNAIVLYDKIPMTYFETLRKKLQYDNIPTIYIGNMEAKDLYGVIKNNFN